MYVKLKMPINKYTQLRIFITIDIDLKNYLI